MGEDNQDPLACESVRLSATPGAMPTLAVGMRCVSGLPDAHGKRGHGTVSQYSSRWPKSEFRRGLTLIEVTLVLALMVVIASFCWPAINRAFYIQRLKKSADIVRIQWCKSRVKAMSTDQIVLFRYEMGGSRFRIEQLIDVTAFENMSGNGATPDSNATSNAASLGDPAAASADGASENSDYPSAGGVQSLPKGIVFRGCEIENDSRAMTAGAGSTDNSAAAGWSAPIYFYPDGTSSNARLQICNDRNSAIELALRGMTGVVTVGEVVAVGGAVP